jgi:PAS domain S-box-containing protein
LSEAFRVKEDTLRILLVEDSAEDREITRRFLRKASGRKLDIQEHSRGTDALPACLAEPPDCLLLDLHLLDGEGLAFLRKLREEAGTIPCPIVILTSKADEELAREAIALGAQDYLLKDRLDADGLYRSVQYAIQRFAIARELEQRNREREQAQKALAESEERYRTLVQATSSIVWTRAPSGEFTAPQPAWESYTGQTWERHKGWGWLEAIHPEEREGVREAWRRAIAAGTTFEIAERLWHAASGQYRHVEVRGALLVGNDGQVREIIGTTFDVEERTRLDERLRQAAKLESIGVLAGGIAHDFNNLLTSVIGNTSLAIDWLSTPEDARPLLKQVLIASERAADLTRQMLAYSGRGIFFLKEISLSETVDEMMRLLAISIPRSVRMEQDLAPELPPVLADPAQMLQLIMNLAINAAEACGNAPGVVKISTSLEQIDAALPNGVGASQLQPGAYVCLRVTDTGSGMDEATVAKIFDPFFSTKFTGRGLGLAAAQGIVRSHKGAIRVKTAPGRGSTFEVLLPAAASTRERPQARPREVQSARDLRGRGAVLVVDDEELVRGTAQRALERYGYEVLLAGNGLEAVELFEKRAREIGAVILDLTMPIMGGEEAYGRLKQIRKDVPIILSSGFSEEEAQRRFEGRGLAGFLQKPYRSSALAEKLKSVASF